MRLAISALALLALVFPCTVQAGGGKKANKPDGVRGVVVSVDTTAKTFTFRSGKKDSAVTRTIQFDDNTKFVTTSDDGTTDAKSDALTARSHASVVFEEKDGKTLASKVTILPHAAKKK